MSTNQVPYGGYNDAADYERYIGEEEERVERASEALDMAADLALDEMLLEEGQQEGVI